MTMLQREEQEATKHVRVVVFIINLMVGCTFYEYNIALLQCHAPLLLLRVPDKTSSQQAGYLRFSVLNSAFSEGFLYHCL